ncbi:DNA recombination protein RmuC [Corynebacterium sp. CCM 8835]|uniref:DNA recombination protein RmuC n=1 Tax=Corynebacterium antarcticum TaxID=2800405 RepID=A0A9Q4CCT7_9CORY|nr:DNA recombination protein RmuC [Corynebacterium antarcticum]MCK7642883.1 DNA recombination protein RmuC [Corynebacterium antarcticum]MCL0246123.1 DNA recombination protein RmuC [Corynebacterium antarcticum]MCX7492372.1 DNA recombination protein RmuC [Corynebacterium antarcticum]MCX7538514.1 DNA recombination protein RmuC [Corynebacterium antarcticum]MCX7540712.1 DNA recombination protein RmuC [Corynebacterium antarcticum]
MSPSVTFLLTLVLGIAIGAVLGWLARGQNSRATATDVERLAELASAQLRADTAERTSAAAEQLTGRVSTSLAPLQQAVVQLSQQVRALEQERVEAYAALSSQVQSMTRTSTMLSDRTGKLVTALRAPQVRGRWGEMQLERVVEMAGMVRYCDFDTQVSARGPEGPLRPDLVVRLSGGRTIIVDSKVPFSAYLDALDTEDPEEHAAHLRRHAHQLRTHVNQLSSKNYSAAFERTPEFTVLFVPADPFLDAALTTDPELLEHAFSRNIILATPTTLVALLRTVGLGWQQEAVNEQAAAIHRLGRQLYSRLNTMAEHYNKVGTALDRAVDAYNSTLGSLESRVMVTARTLNEMEAGPGGSTRPTVLRQATGRGRRIAPVEASGAPESGTEDA